MAVYRIAFCFLLFCGTAHAAPLYNITLLDLLPGSTDSLAFGLNDIAQPVGDSRLDRSGNIGQARPVIWDSLGIPTELWADPFVGGSAADINNSGTIVGRYGSGSGTPLPGPGVPFGRGFVWDSINGRRDLGLEPVGNTQAVAINDSGQVVGTSEVLTTVNIEGEPQELFIPRAFLWDQTSGIRDLGDIGGFGAFANDVNSQGQVVGYADNPDGFTRAFVWDADGGGMRELGTPPGGGSSRARAINDNGQVGGFESGGGGFIWDDVSGFSSIGVGNPFDINNSGIVVGGGALIWDSTNGTRSLIDLIPPDSEWQLDFAFAINESGGIVGIGQVGGETRGFYLTPIPEPSSIFIAILAAIAAGTVRHISTL